MVEDNEKKMESAESLAKSANDLAKRVFMTMAEAPVVDVVNSLPVFQHTIHEIIETLIKRQDLGPATPAGHREAWLDSIADEVSKTAAAIQLLRAWAAPAKEVVH